MTAVSTFFELDVRFVSLVGALALTAVFMLRQWQSKLKRQPIRTKVQHRR